MTEECIFCKIVAGDIPSSRIYEDEELIAFEDINPKAQIHLVVIPRRHIASLNELEPGDDGLVARMMRLLPRLAAERGLDEGFRTIINTGKGGGQEVFHLHAHLLGGSDLPGF